MGIYQYQDYVMNLGPTKVNDDCQIYIFEAMQPETGWKRLTTQANKRPDLQVIKDSGTVLWLLRASRQPGMLTIDCIAWDKEKGDWAKSNTRMALTPAGWINASDINSPIIQEALKSMQNISPKEAGKHKDSLEKYISDYNVNSSTVKGLAWRFKIENRVNPKKSEQTNTSLYTDYIIAEIDDLPQPPPILTAAKLIEKKDASKKVTQVSLTPDVIQAISCEITGQTFKEPVVILSDMLIKTKEGVSFQLRKGQSYEKAALLAAGVGAANFYVNFQLGKIIDRLGANNAEKLEKLEAERLQDAVFLDTMEDPYILPSGHSFNKRTIDEMVRSGRSLACPNTRTPFQIANVVKNINLEQFTQTWPGCRDQLIESIVHRIAKL